MCKLCKWRGCNEEVAPLFVIILLPSKMTANGIQVVLTAPQNSDLEFPRQRSQTSV